MNERRAKIHIVHELPKTRRCELLDVARSSAYYQPELVAAQDLALMRLIDEIHLQYPFYGSRRLRNELEDRGHTVNRKRIQRLMRKMDLTALYPRRRTSQPGKGHKVYPYLLRHLSIERANQVWATDITYCPMAKGFMYLIAIIDWHSRRVLSWRVANTLDTSFCVEALEEALQRFGTPESTPIRAHSSPPRRSPTCSKTRAWRSAWTARDDGSTTCSSRGCGAV